MASDDSIAGISYEILARDTGATFSYLYDHGKMIDTGIWDMSIDILSESIEALEPAQRDKISKFVKSADEILARAGINHREDIKKMFFQLRFDFENVDLKAFTILEGNFDKVIILDWMKTDISPKMKTIQYRSHVAYSFYVDRLRISLIFLSRDSLVICSSEETVKHFLRIYDGEAEEADENRRFRFVWDRMNKDGIYWMFFHLPPRMMESLRNNPEFAYFRSFLNIDYLTADGDYKDDIQSSTFYTYFTDKKSRKQVLNVANGYRLIMKSMYAEDTFLSRRFEDLKIIEDVKNSVITIKSEERLKENLPALKEYIKRELKNAMNEIERRSRESILNEG
jgi:hypothetical protein